MKSKKEAVLLPPLVLMLVLSGCLGGLGNNGEPLSIEELREDLSDSINNRLLAYYPNSSVDTLIGETHPGVHPREPSYRFRSACIQLINNEVLDLEVEEEHAMEEREYELYVNSSPEDIVEFLNASHSVEGWGNLSITQKNLKVSEVRIVVHSDAEEPRIRFMEIFIDFSVGSRDYRSKTTLGFNPGIMDKDTNIV